MKKSTKKLIGLILTLALIISQTSVAFFATAETASSGTFIDTLDYGSYEERIFWNGQGGSTITENTVDGDTEYLMDLGSWNGFALFPMDDNGNRYTFSLDKGATAKYLVKFDYKYENGGTNALELSVGAYNPSTNKGSGWSTVSITNTHEIAQDKKWHTVAVEYTFTNNNDWDTEFVLGIDNTATGWNVYYLDNFKIIPIEDGQSVGTVNFETNGGNTIAPEKGVVGADYEMPVPFKGNYEYFAGWYTDEALTTAYNGTFPANGTTLYAKWNGKTIIDTLDYGSYEERIFWNGQGGSTITENTVDGDTEYLMDLGSWNGFALFPMDTNGNRYTFSLDKGATAKYLVKFDYKYENGGTNALELSVGAYNPSTNKGSGWSTVSITNTHEIAKDKKWHTVAVEYTFTNNTDWDTEFVLGIDNSATGWNVYYLDNFKIIPIEDGQSVGTVSFETNGGNTIAPEKGVVGADYEMPVPTKDAYDFVGWYTDAELTNAYDGKFPADGTTLYAKWNGKIIIDTLDYGSYEERIFWNGQGGSTITENTVDGDTEYLMDLGSWNGFALFPMDTNGNRYTFSLDKGATAKYLVKFDYKYENGGTNALEISVGAYNPSTNKGSGWSTVSITNTHEIAKDKKWHTVAVEYTFTNNTDWDTEFVLGIDNSATGWNVYYLDNFKIIPIEDGQSVGTVNFETNGGNTIAPEKGVVGADYEMPVATKNGFAFAGWYTDEALTTAYNGKFPADGTTLYAKWAEVEPLVDNLEHDADRLLNVKSDYVEVEIADGAGADGGKAIHAKTIAEYKNSVGGYVVVPKDENDNAFTVDMKAGTRYRYILKFDYKVVDGYEWAGIWAKTHLLNSSTKEQVKQTTYVVIQQNRDLTKYETWGGVYGLADGNWRTAELLLDYTPTADVTVDIGLFFDAGVVGEYYLDNFEIITVYDGEETANVFYEANGGIAVDRDIAIVGEEFTAPATEKENGEFVGWYTDAAMTIAFDGNVSAGDNMLYAKYKVHSMYDYNNDGVVDIRDLVNLKKKAVADSGKYTADMLVTLRKILLNPEFIVKTIGNETYTLTWNDEFDSINTNTWNLVNTEATEDANGYNVSYNANNVTASNGTASLSTNADASAKTASAVRLDTQGKMDFKYGYIEARVKGTAKGVNSCFWLNAHKIGGKAMEIDLTETFGEKDQFATNIHFWNAFETDATSGNYHMNLGDVLGDTRTQKVNNINENYYTIGMLWTPEKFEFYLNGNLYLSVTMSELQAAVAEYDYEDILKTPLCLIFSAVPNTSFDSWSWSLNNSFDYPLTIDYVRLYQNVNQAELTIK